MWILGIAIVSFAVALSILVILIAKEDHIVGNRKLWQPWDLPLVIMPDPDLILPIRVWGALRRAFVFWDGSLPGLVGELKFFQAGGAIVPIMAREKFSGDWPDDRFAVTHIFRVRGAGRFSAGIYVDLKAAEQLSDAEVTRGLAHEIGHALGLDHSEDPRSPMHSKLSSSPMKLGDAEIETLTEFYGTLTAQTEQR